MNYSKFRKQVGISNAEMTETLVKRFPNYSKITASMINQPSKYGVALSKEAERYLKKYYGITSKPKPKRKQITVRISDETYEKLQGRLEGQTLQDYVENLLK